MSRENKGCLMAILGGNLFILLLHIAMIITWIINLIQLLRCDFQEPWREEIIHAIGLIPYASLITVWF